MIAKHFLQWLVWKVCLEWWNGCLECLVWKDYLQWLFWKNCLHKNVCLEKWLVRIVTRKWIASNDYLETITCNCYFETIVYSETVAWDDYS